MGAIDIIDSRIERAFNSQRLGGRLLLRMGADPKMVRRAAPTDDGVPPAAPTGVVVDAFLAALAVNWDDPPYSDYVERVILTVTPENEASYEVQAESMRGHTLHGLPIKPHTIRVRFVDMWGRESANSAPVTARPLETAEYEIDLAKAEQLGRLKNLIPAINTRLLEGEEFAEGVIRSVSLAAGMNPNLLTLLEVDFEGWPRGIDWPPTVEQGNSALDANGNAVPAFTASIPSGHLAKLITLKDRNWLRHERTTSSSPGIIPFADWSPRSTNEGREYIYSAYCRGSQGLNVRLDVQVAQDASGTGAYTITGQQFTLTGNPDGDRVWVKFQVPQGYPYIRFRLCNLQDNATVHWTKMKLERGEGKSEPGPWDAGALATGTITARSISALDATAVNAIFANAAITDAKIKNLKVDKLEGGTLRASESITCAGTIQTSGGGVIKTAGAKMTADGIELTVGGSSVGFPSGGARDWLTPPRNYGADPKPYAGIGFFDSSSPSLRGISIAASGVAGGGKDGYIRLIADNGGRNNDANSTARIFLMSSSEGGAGVVNLHRDVVVSNQLTVNGPLVAQHALKVSPQGPGLEIGAWVPAFSLPSDQIQFQQHNLGVIPTYLLFQKRLGGQTSWRPISEGGGIAQIAADDTFVAFYQSSGSAFSVRGWCGK